MIFFSDWIDTLYKVEQNNIVLIYTAQIHYFIGMNFRGYKLSRFREFFWRIFLAFAKVYTREIACSVALAKVYTREI